MNREPKFSSFKECQNVRHDPGFLSSLDESSEELKLVNRKPQLKPTSFRLTPEDSDRLKAITAAVKELSPYKKISETMVVRALLFNGQKMKPESLLKAIREVIL